MKTIKYMSLLIILFFGMMSCKESESKKTQAEEVSEAVTTQEVVSLLNSEDFEKHINAVGDVQVVDVRTPEEVAEGTIAGSIHFDFYADDFKEQLKVLDKDNPVYVFCRSGRRSADTAAMMEEMGFTRVYDLDGGIVAWQDSGREVVK
ncbi:rhodanese-like domain-containing protein [Aureitalea sp. L0-47]|uniref:rhodanese-like domain-containing protein n=1 Tax=Aureitalea sp. L0-47 TaxID=2816962 RepID=UPI002237D141|nr:rhodanese-like domain-containing protein [Aureitalea sp. L0-47]MCW5520724.1 rhodanese-like domain-containing protein [Aureitalea sp. L0-47]